MLQTAIIRKYFGDDIKVDLHIVSIDLAYVRIVTICWIYIQNPIIYYNLE